MFEKEVLSRRVSLSLIPIVLFSVYLYGISSILILAVSLVVGILTEGLFMKIYKRKVSESVIVSCLLFALSMPGGIPLWVVGLGIFFGILFAKCVFGGYGRNTYNPAIAGILFVYITFPGVVSSSWLTPGMMGGAQALSGATPLGMIATGESPGLMTLLMGVRPGALGESAVALILLGGLILVLTRTSSGWVVFSCLHGFLGLGFIFFVSGLFPYSPIDSLLAGSALFTIFYFAADPVTAPKSPQGKYLYGFIIGVSIFLIRVFSNFPEGTSFAVAIGNSFACLFDEWFSGQKELSK